MSPRPAPGSCRRPPPAPSDGPAAGSGRHLVGARLVLSPDTRRLGPGLLSGGSPWRLLRLSDEGDRWIDRWAVGECVPDRPGACRLAGRLVDAGMASARLGPGPPRSVTVVVPCRDRDTGLAVTLEALDPGVAVVVVDDGSARPAATARVVAGRPGTQLVRRERGGGPAAARNDGWRRDGDGPADGSELVAFLDADCLPPPGWLAELSRHFADPHLGAVAPRVGADPAPGGAGWLLTYERVRSPLDLGAVPAPVRPGAVVPYVPTAALVVRRAALAGIGGFDEGLATGEDVDLVWRLDRAGWAVRYDPSIVVGHPVRPTLRSWAAQRAGYGRSAAALAARHGRAVAPVSVSRWSATAWMLVASGHPLAGAGVAAVSAARLGRRVGAGVPPTLGPVVRLAWRGHLVTGKGLAGALRREWWPLVAVTAVVSRRARRGLLAVALVPPMAQWVRSRPPLGWAAWVALRLADDVAYGAGVWAGAVRARRVTCLLPDLR